MLEDEFNNQRANLLRELASRADPFIKRRLLDLAARYETKLAKTRPLPPVSINLQADADH
jgi:hypothetical protein